MSHDEPSQTLRVRDNGRGIDNFQKLLTFHESGWQEPIAQQEHAFGIGFDLAPEKRIPCRAMKLARRIEECKRDRGRSTRSNTSWKRCG